MLPDRLDWSEIEVDVGFFGYVKSSRLTANQIIVEIVEVAVVDIHSVIEEIVVIGEIDNIPVLNGGVISTMYTILSLYSLVV